ncbi:MAG: hypothetical protein SVU24_06060, partial [Pseudomonadota bacterium]|nr:hypothetical protein [Pseudomonadota bacterium]
LAHPQLFSLLGLRLRRFGPLSLDRYRLRLDPARLLFWRPFFRRLLFDLLSLGYFSRIRTLLFTPAPGLELPLLLSPLPAPFANQDDHHYQHEQRGRADPGQHGRVETAIGHPGVERFHNL